MRLKYLIIFIAITLILFFTYKFFFIGLSTEQNGTLSTPPDFVAKQKDSTSLLSKEKQQREDINLAWADFVYPMQANMRNPFQREETQVESASVEKKSPSFLILTGIIYKKENPIAIFTDKEGNSYLVDDKKNSKILDYTVKKILKRSVILSKSNMDVEFKVFDDEGVQLKTDKAQIEKLPSSPNNLKVRESDEMMSRNESEAELRKEDEIKLMGNPFNNKSYDTIIPGLRKRARVLLNQK